MPDSHKGRKIRKPRHRAGELETIAPNSYFGHHNQQMRSHDPFNARALRHHGGWHQWKLRIPPGATYEGRHEGVKSG
jgi:hypothetical protein